MYITVASVKRNLGFKGLEVSDLIIAFPFIALFLVLFCFTDLKLLGLSVLIIGFFALIPVTVSKKNRMYKVLMMVGKYLISDKEFTYFTTEERKMLIDKIGKRKSNDLQG